MGGDSVKARRIKVLLLDVCVVLSISVLGRLCVLSTGA